MTIMRRFAALLMTAALGVLGALPACAAPASEQSVRELLEVTGAGNLGIQVMQQMLPGLKQLAPDLPESYWKEFMDEVDPDELVGLVVPIYQKHYSDEEVRELITFYRSPIGQKVVRTLPQVMQESMAAGQQWGQKLGQRVIERARAKRAEGAASDH